jgi:hypothetical protein
MASPDFDRNFSSATRFFSTRKKKRAALISLKQEREKSFPFFFFCLFSSELTPKEIMKKMVSTNVKMFFVSFLVCLVSTGAVRQSSQSTATSSASASTTVGQSSPEGQR